MRFYVRATLGVVLPVAGVFISILVLTLPSARGEPAAQGMGEDRASVLGDSGLFAAFGPFSAYNEFCPLISGSFPIGFFYGNFLVTNADLDGDGDLDLITLSNSNDVVIIKNDGSGGFQAEASYPVHNGPRDFCATDVDGDGDIDIITANSANISVLHNNGDGTFGPRVPFALPGSAFRMACADVELDGDVDVVVLESACSPAGRLWVLRNDGSGDFTSLESYNVNTCFYSPSLAVADITGDLFPDVVMSNGYSGQTWLLANQGDGTFAMPGQAFPGGAYAAALGDVDGDGDRDVLLSPGNNELQLLPNDGSGNLGAPIVWTLTSAVTLQTLCDLNLDGLPDVIGSDASGNLAVAMNAAGTFGAVTQLVTQSGIQSVTCADMDNDGDSDVLSLIGNNVIQAFNNLGDGRLASQIFVLSGDEPRAMATADFDGDLADDLVVADLLSADVLILRNMGLGVFEEAFFAKSSGRPNDLAVCDLDGANGPDILTVNPNSNSLTVLLGMGGFGFQTEIAYFIGGMPQSVICGDVNNDGCPDVVTLHGQTHEVGVMLNLCDGSGGLAAPVFYAMGSNPQQIMLANLDGDAMPDLVVRRGSWPYGADYALNQGDGTFGTPSSMNTWYPLYNMAATDIDQDGDDDLLYTTYGAVCELLLLRNMGGLVFQEETLVGNNCQLAGPIELVDFGGDGDTDFIIGSSTLTVVINDGPNGFFVMDPFYVSSSSAVLAMDADGDGDLDVVNAEPQTDRIRITINECPITCTLGDITDDGLIDMGDVAPFVAVLLGINGDPVAGCASDLNGDGVSDGLDAQLFVDLLIQP